MKMSVRRFAILFCLPFIACDDDKSGYLLLKNGYLITMADSAARITKGSVLIRDSIIWKVGENLESSIPKNCTVIDCEGRFIIPGLWDTHVHLFKATRKVLPDFLKFGVTSVRDMGGDTDTLKAIIRDVKAGRIVGPRILFCGPAFESPWWMDWWRKNRREQPPIEDVSRTRVNLKSAESAQRLVDSVVALGVDFIKVRDYSDESTYWALSRAARRSGVALAGHAPYGLDPVKVVDSAQTSFEHGWYPSFQGMKQSRIDSIIRELRAKGCVLVPTLVTWKYNGFSTYEHLDSLVNGPPNVRDPRIDDLPAILVREWRAQLEERKNNNNLKAWKGDVMDGMLKETSMMYGRGIGVMPGTDLAGVMIFPGESLHDELSLFVEKLKMTPYEVLASATITPARYFRQFDKVGTLAPEKLADLVVLEKDPLENIGNARSVVLTIKNGEIVFDRGNQ